MRKFLNNPAELVEESLVGFAAAHPDIVRYDRGARFVARADGPVAHKVGLISAGGSGCEPLHGGYVGMGMLDVACPGQVFTSPVPRQLLAAIELADTGAGVVQIVKNYPGEVMNFRLAALESADDGRAVETVRVNDDVAIPDPDRRRGLGATVLVEKIAGAAAERGDDLAAVAELGRRVNRRARSFGVALSSCTPPSRGKRIFDLPVGEMEVGVGISGEPGVRREPVADARQIAATMVGPIIEDLGQRETEQVLVLLSGLGGTPSIELYLLYNEVDRQLRHLGLEPVRSLVGNYITSLEQAGATLTLLELDEELRELWDQTSANHRTPLGGMRWTAKPLRTG